MSVGERVRVRAAERAIEGGFLDDLIDAFYAACGREAESEVVKACRVRVADAFDARIRDVARAVGSRAAGLRPLRTGTAVERAFLGRRIR